jgi:hypothetical protein
MINTNEKPDKNQKKPKKKTEETYELLDRNDPTLKAWMSVRAILKDIGAPKTGTVKRLKPKKQPRI